MFKIKTETITSIYPPCGCENAKAHCITYLLGTETSFGPWYCSECGKAYYGEVMSDGNIVDTTDKYTSKFKIPLAVVMRMGDVTVFGIGATFAKDGEILDVVDIKERQRYWIEESRCPVNFFDRNIVAFIATDTDGSIDTDPHGVIKLIDCAVLSYPQYRELRDGDTEGVYRSLFPSVFKTMEQRNEGQSNATRH